MAESFLGALNLVVQTLGRLEDVVEAAVEDASGITAWGKVCLRSSTVFGRA
jgi:hypothetical protein